LTNSPVSLSKYRSTSRRSFRDTFTPSAGRSLTFASPTVARVNALSFSGARVATHPAYACSPASATSSLPISFVSSPTFSHPLSLSNTLTTRNFCPPASTSMSAFTWSAPWVTTSPATSSA
jgi:hypothetical protein